MKRRHVQPVIDGLAAFITPSLAFIGSSMIYQESDKVPAELMARVVDIMTKADALKNDLIRYRMSLPPEKKDE